MGKYRKDHLGYKAPAHMLDALLRLLRRPEASLLLTGFAVAGAIWAFLSIAGEVREGDTGAIDRMVLLAFRVHGDPAQPIGPRWLQEMERDFTALGGFTVLTLISAFAITMLLVHRRRLQALIFFVAVIGAQALAELVKHFVARPRPDLITQLDLTYSSSFPSGHAMMAPVVYLTLAALLSAGEAGRTSRLLLVGGAVALVLAIGVSRVYLGVHWPSDVLGGWALGCGVAFIASWALHRTAPKRQREAVGLDTSETG